MPQSAIAAGDIYPTRFVKLDPSNTGKVLQCGAGDRPIGISQQGTRRSPYVDSSGKAAAAGEPIQYYDLTEECDLEIAGTVAPMDRIKSDANGKGVKTTTNTDQYGAVAIHEGTSGKRVRVKVVYGEVSV